MAVELTDHQTRVRHVFSNARCVKAWVRQSHDTWGENGNRSIFFEDHIIFSYRRSFPLAVRLESGTYLLNSDKVSPTTTQHQNLVRSTLETFHHEMILIPFSALEAAGFTWRWRGYWGGGDRKYVEDIVPVDVERDRQVLVGTYEDGSPQFMHLMGSSLFRAGEDMYLSGLDETAYNPWSSFFLTKLKQKNITTVTEAYEALMPFEVLEAELEEREIRRQGEWFFVYQGEKQPEGELRKYYAPVHPDTGEGHHFATQVVIAPGGATYVSGMVRHRPGVPQKDYKSWNDMPIYRNPEHRQLKLSGWWRMVGNVQAGSWSARGYVD